MAGWPHPMCRAGSVAEETAEGETSRQTQLKVGEAAHRELAGGAPLPAAPTNWLHCLPAYVFTRQIPLSADVRLAFPPCSRGGLPPGAFSLVPPRAGVSALARPGGAWGSTPGARSPGVPGGRGRFWLSGVVSPGSGWQHHEWPPVPGSGERRGREGLRGTGAK